nr:GNAT family N-acetyltransferase [Acinetobacter sp. YH16032]
MVAVDHSVKEKFSLVSHVAVSSVKLSNADTDWYGLGAVFVIPNAQNRGVGKALMRKLCLS